MRETVKYTKYAAIAVALFSVALAFTASARMSVTVDEFQSLPAGLAMIETGNYRYPKGTPALSELLPALPLWLAATTFSLTFFKK